MARPRSLLFIGLALLTARIPIAGAAALHFEPVRSETDAPASVVTAIYQDRSRFIWIGSREGLTLYDGYTFTPFTHDPADPTSISDNAIRTIFEDSRGALWIGTNTGGLNRLDRQTYRFEHFRHDSADPGSLSNDSVYAIVEGPDGALWVGTQQGLNRLDPSTGKVDRFMAAPDTGGLSNDYITSVLAEADGRLWIGTVGGGLNLFDPQTGRFTTFRHTPGDPRSLGDDQVFALLAAHPMKQVGGSDLLVGTNDGLFLMDRASRAFRRFAPRGPEDGDGKGLLVTTLSPAEGGKAWVGTHDSGLFEADLDGATLRAIRGDGGRPEGGPPDRGRSERGRSERGRSERGRLEEARPEEPGADRIISLCTEQTGALWIGTWGAGLRRLSPSAMLLAAEADRVRMPVGIEDPDVTAEASDRRGGLWLGTRSGDLIHRDRSGSVSRRMLDSSAPTINTIFEARDGRVWVGANDQMVRIDPATGAAARYRHDPADPASIGPGHVRAIVEDGNGRLWIGTGEGGVQQMDAEGRVSRRFLHDDSDPGTLSDNYVTTLRCDRGGTLWVGTRSGGLNALDPGSGRVVRHEPNSNAPGAISHHYVTSILEDSHGRLWIGTGGGGLDRLESGPGVGVSGVGAGGARFARLTTANGLIDDNVMSILEDDDGSLWLSTRRGLSRYDPEGGSFSNYFVADGLPSADFESGSAARTATGLYFGSVRWVVSVPAGTPRSPAAPSPTVITSIRTPSGELRGGELRGGRPIATMETQGPGGRAAAAVLEIPYGEWLSIELAVLDYGASRSHAYAYRLQEGTGWIDLESRRAITFSRMEPGTYAFTGRGRNRQGVWSETSPALMLRIVPPFWMTAWFRASLGLCVVAAGFLAHRVRLSSLERRNRELLDLHAQRERAREEERKSIARELHDEMGPALTAVVINLQLLADGADPARAARRRAESIEIIDRMVQRIRDVSLDLRPPLLDEMGLVPALRGYLETQAERTGLQIEVRGPQAVPDLPPDVEIAAFRVAQEAVTNVIRHAGARRTVVTVDRRDSHLDLSVEDDGRGFDVRHTMESKGVGKSLGLLGMQERVRMLGGELRIESVAGRGTRVHARVPLDARVPPDARGPVDGRGPVDARGPVNARK